MMFCASSINIIVLLDDRENWHNLSTWFSQANHGYYREEHMPLITISQNLGSGGKEIAQLVAKGLNLNLFDDARLQKEALDSGVRTEDLKHLNEKMPNLFDRILGTNPDVYIDVMESVVYEVSKRGEGVIIGHCSQMLLRDFSCALHVRINASEEKRIDTLMQEKNLTRKNAEKLIRKSDSQLNGFFKYAFHMDLGDPSLYDVILNPEKLSNEAVAKFIIDLATSDEINTCSLNALEAMEKLAQKKKVEAELLRNDISLRLQNVDVPKKGRVLLSGVSNSESEVDRIIEIIQAIPGIADVESSIVIANETF
jgi:cytidylate kinase